MERNFRQRALERIAVLSAASNAPFDRSDLARLCQACHTVGPRETSKELQAKHLGCVPMSVREFEVLLALCKASPSIHSSQSAQRLTAQLVPYMLEVHTQVFVTSPFFQRIEPSPTEALAFHLTGALLMLGVKYTSLQEIVSDAIWSFVNSCSRAAGSLALRDSDAPNPEDSIQIATVAVALLGFLEAASAQAQFWKSGGRMAVVRKLRELLSDTFLVTVETAFSTLRNTQSTDRGIRQWKQYLRHYSSAGRPLGAMLIQRSFMCLIVAATSLMVADIDHLRTAHVLDLLMSGEGQLRPGSSRSVDGNFRSVEMYASIAMDQMNHLEAGADFVRLGSLWHQKLAFAVKSASLITYLNCATLNEDAADADVLMTWLQDSLDDPAQMADESLASVVLRSLALICRISRPFASSVSRLLPRFIVQNAPHGSIVGAASRSLAFVLQMLSTDAIISTLYSLGNVLSPGASDRPITNGIGVVLPPDGNSAYRGRHSTASSISLQISGEEETALVYGNVIEAICGISAACNEDKITALAQSMLLQKIHKISVGVDSIIIVGAAKLALKTGPVEFKSLLKMYSRLCHHGVVENKEILLAAVMRARSQISANLERGSPLYEIYWEHLLETIISIGDIHQSKESDVQLAALEIAELLHPTAIFMSTYDPASDGSSDEETNSKLRDVWFNIVVHGFTSSTDLGKKYLNELRLMATYSSPLVAEHRGEELESDIELNIVLRRDMSTDREAMQKKLLSDLIPSKTSEIRGLSYRKVIFLQSAYLVESLRAEAGDCTKVLSYFLEPSMRKSEVSSTMEGVATVVLEKYLQKSLAGTSPSFSSQFIADQLAAVFCSCCHRIERVQQAALKHADLIIRNVPSALCHKSSLFALLELLSLMWSSCLEAETDVYSPSPTFTSVLGNVTVKLSDDYKVRRHTLEILYREAKTWVSDVLDLAPLDVKGVLQTYLSDFDDEGTYGHISLGRSFALELGSAIPKTDLRLQSLNLVGDITINTASDLVVQYTTRQEYRFGEILPNRGAKLVNLMQHNRRMSFAPSTAERTNAATALAHVEARALDGKITSLEELRDILHRAAALLCRSSGDESAVAHYLVSIPFAIFTKQSIKLGISLWLGVMNENARMEPRLLNEISFQWESTIHRGLGLFSHTLKNPDPFFIKAEFAPSDQESLSRHRENIHNLLSPHSNLLQFFNSHFHATRLRNEQTHKVFLKLLTVTLDAYQSYGPHPMARELRFQIILFGLRFLSCSPTLEEASQYRIKNRLLSAGLTWFRNRPMWSYGSNVLQLKTEICLLRDVMGEMMVVTFDEGVDVAGVQSLRLKAQLLYMLLENERGRLSVWVNPLNDQAAWSYNHLSQKLAAEAVVPLIQTAFMEDPGIAIQLPTRFPSPQVHKQVRQLLCEFPGLAISHPDALPILYGSGLPDDLTDDVLKFLLFWAPINPVTASTMFLPSYKEHPFLIQYAMRSLESHSIDVTFFYVPQIVQTLRYDSLGYVERYILETAQRSQLFAHQIIWNMKANAYKDDDGKEEDAIKPSLDQVMSKIVNSLTPVDRGFYEREFSFFDEVTGISGSLKPLIKQSKPVKKQKIEEELRKIKIQVGVYLPSNPDGTVIGIDRKSGKPLQSHAKAPYMATFRIRKSLGGMAATEALLEETNRRAAAGQLDTAAADGSTVEVWQSAIFKVGDDCRQDVLALQMISVFRNIFHNVGLDVFVFPYRVTATGPGCGVIDVLPNSISRDMLGREAVNGLYEYFTSKYGNEDSLRFQRARANFVKSMAAYSIISYLLQFKDRHNGNIMIDDAGHIVHIDFGFCFDIWPGKSIRVERAPFKLTGEMVDVMGGSTEHQAFRWFEELCVKAFLAARPHADTLAQIVQLMMDSGLSCFQPESVRHFRNRFWLEKSDREAAEAVKDLVKKSYASYSTGIYDQFQLLSNGIPF